MIRLAEIGVNQIFDCFDSAGISQFVDFYPDTVFHHLIQDAERLRFLGVGMPSAIFHDMQHFVVACFVVLADILLYP